MASKKILIGSDHGGFELKSYLIRILNAEGYEVIDKGCNSEDSVDYPVYSAKVAKAIIAKEAPLGILICGTGIGISMAANRFNGVRAGLCTSVEMAELTRLHNNANILAMGGRTTSKELAKEILEAFLSTEYEGGRHDNRVNMMDNVEEL